MCLFVGDLMVELETVQHNVQSEIYLFKLVYTEAWELADERPLLILDDDSEEEEL